MQLSDYDFMDAMSFEERQRYIDQKFAEYEESRELNQLSAQFQDKFDTQSSIVRAICESLRSIN